MATKKTQVKQVEPTSKLYFTADCKVGETEYAAGDQFIPPAGWTHDVKRQELLLSTKQKRGSLVGMVFSYQGEIVNPNEKNKALQERREHSAILPLEVR